MKLLSLISSAGSTVSPKRVRTKLRTALSTMRMLQAFSYESSETGGINETHWSAAGSISARQANSPGVRESLRNRARYETANSSLARGIVDTYAEDLIGDGPRLQVPSTKNQGVSRQDAQKLEQIWNEWVDTVDLWGTLLLAVSSKVTDGEVFSTIVTDEKVDHPVQMNIKLIEAERVANPYSSDIDIREVDGIKFDKNGNPTKYRVLKHHPDDRSIAQVNDENDHDWIDADYIIHFFTARRVGQVRGVPDITPALNQFAQLRRYESATLTAAENAANLATSIQTDNPPDPEDESYSAPEPMDEVPMTPGMATVMPDGYKLFQTKPEHPTTTFADFRRQIANDIGRCLSMPINVVLCDSSKHNFASGKLDRMIYFKKITVDRREFRVTEIDRIFRAWLSQAQLVDGLLPESLRRREPKLKFAWMWPAQIHADPAKEGAGLRHRLETGVSNEIIECANLGHDWQDVLDGQLEVEEYRKELGLTTPEKTPALSSGNSNSDNREDDDEDE